MTPAAHIRSLRSRLGLAILFATFATLLSAVPADANRTLYTTGVFGPPVGAFDIGDDGALAPVSGSPFGSPMVNSDAVALTPDGRHLYVTSAGTQQILAYRTGSDGGLTPITGITFPFGPPDPDPTGIAISPSGSHAYVADPGPEGVRVFAIGADGTLTSEGITPVPGADNTVAVAITPDGRYLYATSSNPPAGVYGFRIAADGGLTPLGGFPAAISSSPNAMTLTPDGRYLYVARNFLTGIVGFAIADDGTLTETPMSPYAFLVTALAADPTADRLFAAFTGPSGGVGAITINPDGSLTTIGFLGVSHETGTLAVAPDASRIYAGGGIGMTSKISGFDVGAGGALTLVPGSPFDPQAELPNPQGYAFSPDQPPAAVVTLARGTTRNEVRFDGAASTDVDGSVAGYAWEFGDGTASTEGPAVTHAYADDRVYTAALATTDDEGCSTEQVFTGQTAACNGGPGAQVSVEVDLEPPVLTLSGSKRQRLGRAIRVGASCKDACDVAGTGTIAIKGGSGKRKLKLKGVKSSVPQAGATVKLKLKLSRGARRKAARAFDAGAKLKAKLSFTASEELVDAEPVRRAVRLRPRR